MQDSVAQHDNYGNQGMHYMGNIVLLNTPQDAEEEFIHSVCGINYFDTYAPVVTQFVIRTIITISILFQLSLTQIDFIQAYTQAPIEAEKYMELPKGIETYHGNLKDHVLMQLSNLYGQKQAGCVWNSFPVEKLLSLGFQQSLINECIIF